MKKIVDFWKSLDGHAFVRKRELLLVGLNLFLWGLNLGLLLSPRKTVVIGKQETEEPKKKHRGLLHRK